MSEFKIKYAIDFTRIIHEEGGTGRPTVKTILRGDELKKWVKDRGFPISVLDGLDIDGESIVITEGINDNTNI